MSPPPSIYYSAPQQRAEWFASRLHDVPLVKQKLLCMSRALPWGEIRDVVGFLSRDKPADHRSEDLPALFVVGPELQKGSHARVARGQCRRTGGSFALKMVRKAAPFCPGFGGQRDTLRMCREALIRERELLEGLDHPNIVKYHHCCESATDACIVLDLHDTDLHTYIARKRVTPDSIPDILRQTLQGVAAMHAAGVAHRDLKCENVLITEGKAGRHVVVCDLGLAKKFSSGDPHSCYDDEPAGTPNYMAPEVLSASLQRVGRSGLRECLGVDVFSFGVIAYAMVTGRTPWKAERPTLYHYRMLLQLQRKGAPFDGFRDKAKWDAAPAPLRHLTAAALTVSSAERPTAQDALSHEFFCPQQEIVEAP